MFYFQPRSEGGPRCRHAAASNAPRSQRFEASNAGPAEAMARRFTSFLAVFDVENAQPVAS